MIWELETEPFGEETGLYQKAGFTHNHRFPGQYYEQETGLSYNYRRFYDPSIGRYIQYDPIGISAGMNTYLYADARPATRIDPAGESAVAGALPIAGGAAVADGPFPLGDLLGAGLLAGALIYDMCTTESCPPCKTVSGRVVPVGTIGYRALDYPPPGKVEHGIDGPHYNVYKANQNPNTCQCFWQRQGAVPPDALPPGAIPIEPFAN